MLLLATLLAGDHCLPTAMAGYIDVGTNPPIKAAGIGLFDGPAENGGFEKPSIDIANIRPPEKLDKEMKGPVRRIREYTCTGSGHIVPASVTEYDRKGRLIRKINYKNGVVAEKQITSFSPRGNRREIEYTHENTQGGADYDHLGRNISTFYHDKKNQWIHNTTTRYDEHNRKIGWSEVKDPRRCMRGWIVYNSSGQISHTEDVTNGMRDITEYRYSSMQNVNYYKQLHDYTLSKEAIWTYGAQGMLITVRYCPNTCDLRNRRR